MTATVLSKIGSAKEGSDVPGVTIPEQRVDRKEVWEASIMDQADREGILKVMNRASQGIINENVIGRGRKHVCRRHERQ